MDQETLLKQTVAEYMGKDSSSITAETSLVGGRMAGSMALAQLTAAIRRRMGVRNEKIYAAKTYGDLEAIILGKALTPGASVATEAPAAPQDMLCSSASLGTGLSCGVDIELVENLATVADYWSDPFYQAHFAKAEIAYCIVQEHPRMHFAARWAAKEALRKSDASLMRVPMDMIEILSDAQGKPFVCLLVDGERKRLSHAVSLTHTAQLAAAIAVCIK